MEETLLRNLSELIRARTGWEVRDSDRTRLRERIQSRSSVLRLTVESYCRRLEQNPADPEWHELVALLSNPETFFFRDTGQIALLRSRVLPDLIARRQAQRTLRLWSAGCSTGEEPYSLAILIRSLIPDHAAWDVRIIGTDVNENSLRKARSARYSQWSFRNAPPELTGFFHQRGTEWELAPEIRQMVTFRMGNLLQDNFPSAVSELCDFDLIVCRNVFIYFNRAAVGAVVRKLAAALAPEGYLLTGHAELHDQQVPDLAVRRFPESLVYQRSTGDGQTARGEDRRPARRDLPSTADAARVRASFAPLRPVRPSPAPHSANSSNPSSSSRPAYPAPHSRPTTAGGDSALETALTEIRELLRQGAGKAALERAEVHLQVHPGRPELLGLAARAAANSGELAKAKQWCEQARDARPFEPEPYHLLAQIAEEQGDLEKAKELLKRCVYLAPAFIPAYLELGDVYARGGDPVRAVRMRSTALQLLRALPPDAGVEPYPDVTAGQLAAQLEPLVRRGA